MSPQWEFVVIVAASFAVVMGLIALFASLRDKDRIK